MSKFSFGPNEIFFPVEMSSSESDETKHIQPKVIYLIRHAHKSLTSTSGDLNALGFAEAEQLIPVFTTVLPKKYGLPVPTRIYSQYPYDLLNPPNLSSVNRVYQTVQPLAQALDKKIITEPTWTKTNYFPMVEQVLRENEKRDVPLIAWQHDTIPNIAQHFGLSGSNSWGLQPLLHLDATETECEFGQVWVLFPQKIVFGLGSKYDFVLGLGPQKRTMDVLQMLFPCLELSSVKCHPNKMPPPLVVGVSQIESCCGSGGKCQPLTKDT